MAIAASPVIETPEILTTDDGAFFVENGYYVAHDLMEPEEIEELRADTLRVAQGRVPMRNARRVARARRNRRQGAGVAR